MVVVVGEAKEMHCGCVFASPPSVSLRPSCEIKISASKLRTLSAQLRRNQIQINPSINDSDKSPNFRVSLPSHVEYITSTSNPFVKHCLKLRQSSSYRHTHGSVLIIGTIPIREVCMFLQANKLRIPTEIDCLLLQEEAQIPQELKNLSLRIVRVSSLVMKKLSGVQSSESIEAIALIRIPKSFIDLKDTKDTTDCNLWFPSSHRILVLDSVQDPGNLGTLLRSAMAFNWDGVFLLPGCCDPFNDKALRASRGVSFQLPIVSGNWKHLKVLKDEFDMKLLAGHPSSSSKKLKLVSKVSVEFVESLVEKPLCLILGSEGNGLSEESRQVCELVSIPMAAEFESLNVSVAGGIFLFMLKPSFNDTKI